MGRCDPPGAAYVYAPIAKPIERSFISQVKRIVQVDGYAGYVKSLSGATLSLRSASDLRW